MEDLNYELFKTDLVAACKLLIDDEIGAYAFADADFLDDTGRLSLDQVHYEDEGDGNYAEAVVQVILDGELLGLVRMTGLYSSWGSTEWYTDELTIVTPVDVVVTEYLAADGSEHKDYRILR